jgi:hypothetical protein
MIQHVWSVLCEGSSFDTETNRVSLFNILESLTVFTNSDPPITIPISFEIVSLWTRTKDGESAQGKMRVYSCMPSGENKQIAETDIDLKNVTFHRNRLKSQGLGLSSAGPYVFRVEMQNQGETDWQVVAYLPLLVSIKPLEPAHNKNKSE